MIPACLTAVCVWNALRFGQCCSEDTLACMHRVPPPQHTHSGRRWALKLREDGGDRGHWLTYWGFWVNLGFHEESNSFDESGVSL